jgi:signal transduction histidine kinase
MQRTSLRSFLRGSTHTAILPLATFFVAATIFVVDSVTVSEIAISVMYVAVVLLSTRLCNRRGIALVGALCVMLTIIAFVITSTWIGQSTVGLVNTVISMAVVSVTTYLVIRIETAQSQAKTLAESEQLRNALIGSVSHELRTPLASILGGASILAETPAISRDERLSILSKGIRDEAVRLNSDIQNLLDAALITSQGLKSRQDWTDPADLLDAAVGRIKARYPDRNFIVQLSGDPALIRVDPVLIEQALAQIIGNAAKFSPPQSTVHITAHTGDGELVISVRDEGVGLTAEEQKRVPERFFRSPRHIGKIPGSGLGLWIADTFIASSGGKLEAVSAGENQGTTIRVVFPISRHVDETGIGAQED